MADVELDANPESTWGASEAYKAAWHEEHGTKSPAANASKGEWVEFATTKGGMSKDDAEGSTRDELVARFGAKTLVEGAPSAPNDAIVGQGSGGAAAPSAADPAVRTPAPRS